MSKHGGKWEGAGRKSKAEEQKLKDHLTPINSKALKSLEQGLDKKEQWAVKLFFEYFYGKPQQRVDVTTNDESINMPLINYVETETELEISSTI